jgi:2-polyprenyl-3-methyl-5-hydroxy-6-metoxy-1,4-benzoquinol methylase
VVEIPALRRLLPPHAGKSVLDLGCGFADFARYARAAGASRVTALHVSRSMLEEAAHLPQIPPSPISTARSKNTPWNLVPLI